MRGKMMIDSMSHLDNESSDGFINLEFNIIIDKNNNLVIRWDLILIE
jgi:hypothetical protein